MSADDGARGGKRRRVLHSDEVFLYEGGQISHEIRREITRVRIGPQVKVINGGAFQRCSNLVEVQFDEGTALQIIGCRAIGCRAFDGCRALRKLAVPAGVTKLCSYAFAGCSNLAGVQLNEGLEFVEEGSFYECEALQQVAIPSSVIEVGDYAFHKCTNIAELLFKEGALQVIGKSAFEECKALQHVILPLSVTKLSKRAFKGCSGLAVVQFNVGFFTSARLWLSWFARFRRPTIGALRVIKEEAFRDCKALQQMAIPPNVTKVGSNAFSGCGNLASVQFNEGLQIIGKGAFKYCKALQKVTIPSSVAEMGALAFCGCINLAEVKFDEGTTLQVIGGNAFKGCDALQQVAIPASVTRLGNGSFKECRNLANVQFTIPSSVTKIGESAFEECESLQQVVIPSSVTELGIYAFLRCRNLAKVHFNEGLEFIGYWAFSGCKALRSVTIPSSVSKLGNWAFDNCINLARVQLNEGLKIIGDCAFHGCTALRSVTVPCTTTILGSQSFGHCRNLTEVTYLRGKGLLNQRFLERGLVCGQGVLYHPEVKRMVAFRGFNAFRDSPVATIKISISQALSERMSRLSLENLLSIEERSRDLRRLELTHDGNILACFSYLRMGSYLFLVEDTDHQTAESLHQVLRLISFHELKESSILIELAMWKSRLDEHRARADCRISVPDPAKSLIMEYCGFTSFLGPAIEGP